MRYTGAGLGPTWPGVNKVASEEGVVLDDKVIYILIIVYWRKWEIEGERDQK